MAAGVVGDLDAGDPHEGDHDLPHQRRDHGARALTPISPISAVFDPVVCLVLEFLPHTLADVLADASVPLSWSRETLAIARDIAGGCEFLHALDPPVRRAPPALRALD